VRHLEPSLGDSGLGELIQSDIQSDSGAPIPVRDALRCENQEALSVLAADDVRVVSPDGQDILTSSSGKSLGSISALLASFSSNIPTAATFHRCRDSSELAY
jgi:hypothetical protein